MTAPPDTYARQLSLPGFGVTAQRRLSESTVLIAGVGGLGGATATYLAAAGVGRLILLHPGRLERPDLNRQTLMSPSWIGHLRTRCAKATLRRHYPDVAVVAVPEPITAGGTSPFLVQADVVVDARHNFPERLLLNRLCVELGVPMVEAAMYGAEGQVSVVRPGETACLACRIGEGDPQWEPLGFPVLGAVAGAVGCLAAIEAIKVVTGWGEPLDDRLLALDLERMIFQTLPVTRDPACPVCAGIHPTPAPGTPVAPEPAGMSAAPRGPVCFDRDVPAPRRQARLRSEVMRVRRSGGDGSQARAGIVRHGGPDNKPLPRIAAAQRSAATTRTPPDPTLGAADAP